MPRHNITDANHLDGLLKYLENTITAPELTCFEPDEMFDAAHEDLDSARTRHAALCGELAELENV